MLLLFLVFLPVLVLSCTEGYNTFYDGQCFKELHYLGEYNYDGVKAACAAEDAHLPMLYTAQVQKQFFDAFYKESTRDSAWIALTCDGEKFLWEDGTIATFTNFEYNQVCDSTKTNWRYYLYYRDGTWQVESNPESGSAMYPLCVANVRSWICDTYWLLEQGKSDDLCYLFYSEQTLVADAEKICESQNAFISPIHDQSINDFVKRTAIGYGKMEGVHIGLKYTNGKYIWSDGSEADYLNFAPGFPDESFGECLAMGTGLFPGKWMNVNCSTPLPYMCTKAANAFDESVKPAGCNGEDGEFYPGDEIFSPTWGSATGPSYCDYAVMDIEDKTRKITVEILLFESNSCCDTLTIYDGLFGTNVLKTLTGYYGITSILVTGTTNAIRMEWNATSGAHVRGFHARVGSVAA